MADDYYALLEVGRNASDDEIKKAYRRLARELHPDTNPDPAAEDRFKKITLAYETLRDPERRRRYDMFGPEGAAAGGGAGGDPFAGMGGIGDIFEAFFGGQSPFGGAAGGRTRRGPVRGPDVETAIELTFEEAVFGVERDVTVKVALGCDECSGSGARPGTTPTTCDTCGGVGEVRRVRQSLLGQVVTSSPCPQCQGMGEQITSPCPTCGGEGRAWGEREERLVVPAGVDDGTTMQLSGRGHAGPRGGPAGDLYVHLRVAPSERFARQGVDLLHRLHVPVTQAALGAVVSFETLDGPEEITIPRGAQSGLVFRLRGRGVPHVRGRGRGDLVVELAVDTPVDLTPAEEDLLRQLAAARGDDVAAPESGFLSKLKSAFK